MRNIFISTLGIDEYYRVSHSMIAQVMWGCFTCCHEHWRVMLVIYIHCFTQVYLCSYIYTLLHYNSHEHILV